MNIGTIITRGLNRANLSVVDLVFRDFANELLDEIIQEHWEDHFWQFRKRSYSISATSGTDEYVLNKLASVQTIVPNSMRGASPVRLIRYRPRSEHNRVIFSSDSGNPYWFSEGTVRGFQTNPSSASPIRFVSSLTNYTTGTVTVVNGSKRLVFASATITIDMIGRWFRAGSDTKAYRIASRDFQSSTTYYISEAYEGVSRAGEPFAIGDIQQKASVLGFVSGQLQEEEIQLNGAAAVSTGKSFSSVLRISKSDRTNGYITADSNAAAVMNVVLDPGETDTDFQTILFYPNPSATETISYDAWTRHPHLYKFTDSPLFPNQYHSLLVIELYIRLMEEWHKKGVSQEVLRRRDKILDRMLAIDNSTDGWKILQETEESSERSRLSNLPVAYGVDDDF